MENREGLKMLFPVVVTGIYAFLVTIGGIIGYKQAHSHMSLYMGLIFGISLMLSSLFMLYGKKVAYIVALVLISALTLFFGYRFALTEKFMPAGFMLILSIVSGLLMLAKNPYKFGNKSL